ncbi:putative phytosulfokines 6 [Manihot esculenta]|uniref:putative phytosulfokines 6 n=1 Tax=Manihot esculenta TaxID=3983 RepID=UPI001CC5421B|nr:putative phytosulfokines 6 [Manihot esculenta]
MKQNSLVLLIFLSFLLLSSTSARILPPKQVGKERRGHGITQLPGTSFTEKKDDVSHLMGSEVDECVEGDEECFQRRMVAEAHLDYIYTQHHNKP